MPRLTGQRDLDLWDQPQAPVRPHQLPYVPSFVKKGFDVFVQRLNREIDHDVLQKSLFKLFKRNVHVLHVFILNDLFGNVYAHVIVPTKIDVHKLIRRFHKVQLFGRHLEFAMEDPNMPVPLTYKRAVIHLFERLNQSRMTLMDLVGSFRNRYGSNLAVADITKMPDIVERYIVDGTQMVRLLPAALYWQANIVRQGCMEHQPVAGCAQHQVFHASEQKLTSCYRVSLSLFSAQVKELVRGHNGRIPLSAFVECFGEEYGPLEVDDVNGVYLEHLLTAIPGVKITSHPFECRLLILAENQRTSSRKEDELGTELAQMLRRFSREVKDMLVVQPRASIPFGQFVQSYRTAYDKMCRVADYGCTRLIDVFSLIENEVQVIGTGSNRIILLQHSQQVARFGKVLDKVRRTFRGYTITPENFLAFYDHTFKRKFLPSSFGVCYAEDLLRKFGIKSTVCLSSIRVPDVSTVVMDETDSGVEGSADTSLLQLTCDLDISEDPAATERSSSCQYPGPLDTIDQKTEKPCEDHSCSEVSGDSSTDYGDGTKVTCPERPGISFKVFPSRRLAIRFPC